MKASLGLHIDARHRRIPLVKPHLPDWLDEVSVFDLEVGGAVVDLSIVRHTGRLSARLLRGEAAVQVQ
jgi:hypothetical protein